MSLAHITINIRARACNDFGIAMQMGKIHG